MFLDEDLREYIQITVLRSNLQGKRRTPRMN